LYKTIAYYTVYCFPLCRRTAGNLQQTIYWKEQENILKNLIIQGTLNIKARLFVILVF